jgi:hypothetical protein
VDEADEGGFHCVVIRELPLPPGYGQSTTNLLLRLPPGFPDASPDMWWCDPPVRLASSGAFPRGAELMETHLGRTWQRFSRHFQPGQWRSGESGLATFVAVIRRDFANGVAMTPE